VSLWARTRPAPLGDTVLVHGVAGGVGLTTAQLALDRGATVMGTAAS
jgi:NADPH:quinone reductase-like Zn-dependent oxidoreductase